jgi:hypothetical protein
MPGSDVEKGMWMGNFSLKIGTYAAQVGVTAAEVTSIQKDAAYFQYVMSLLEVHKQTLNNITSYKNQLKKAIAQQHIGALPSLPAMPAAPPAVSEGIFDRISKLVKRIKASASYNEAMGQDLGIIAPTQVIDVNSLQPELSVKLEAGRPHIKCAKGIADAIDLYVDRGEGNGFVLIGRLPKPDYIDTANLPANTLLAEWDYKAMYVIGNDNAGLMSAPVSVIVKKM